MKKIIRLTENDLTKLVKNIILESVKNDVYSQLIEIAENVDSYEEFEKIVIYYGYTKLKNIDIDLLINTEKVSGLPIVSDSPISVGQDIKTNKYYIIDGHNRVKRAKEKGLKSIEAYVTRGKITRRGGFSIDPETSIFVEENNINLKEFYKKLKD